MTGPAEPATTAADTHDDPVALAATVAMRPRPLLLGLDVDGVLAPIVGHPDEALLLDGVTDVVARLVSLDDVHVVVVSGRSMADLGRFAFPGGVELIGSHGLEIDMPLGVSDHDERARLDTASELAAAAAAGAGAGAFVEHKPFSVVLHVRQADPARGALAIEQLATAVAGQPGLVVKPGSGVLEVLARDGNKGKALTTVIERDGAVTAVYVGDDVTDEDVFVTLRPGDVGIKVGPGTTAATARLADPAAVRVFLDALFDALAVTAS